MKNKLFIVMLALGIVLLLFTFTHWLFLIASVFAFISAFLLKNNAL